MKVGGWGESRIMKGGYEEDCLLAFSNNTHLSKKVSKKQLVLL